MVLMVDSDSQLRESAASALTGRIARTAARKWRSRSANGDHDFHGPHMGAMILTVPIWRRCHHELQMGTMFFTGSKWGPCFANVKSGRVHSLGKAIAAISGGVNLPPSPGTTHSWMSATMALGFARNCSGKLRDRRNLRDVGGKRQAGVVRRPASLNRYRGSA